MALNLSFPTHATFAYCELTHNSIICDVVVCDAIHIKSGIVLTNMKLRTRHKSSHWKEHQLQIACNISSLCRSVDMIILWTTIPPFYMSHTVAWHCSCFVLVVFCIDAHILMASLAFCWRLYVLMHTLFMLWAIIASSPLHVQSTHTKHVHTVFTCKF